MAFISSGGFGSQGMVKGLASIFERKEIRIVPRTGVAFCLVEEHPLGVGQELGLVLGYIHVFFVLLGSDFWGVVYGVAVSLIFSIIVRRIFPNRKKVISKVVETLLACLDLVSVLSLAESASPVGLISVGGISFGILWALYPDNIGKEEIWRFGTKDLAVVAMGMLKHLEVKNSEKAVTAAAVCFLVGYLGCVLMVKREKGDSRSTRSKKKSVQKAARSSKEKLEESEKTVDAQKEEKKPAGKTKKEKQKKEEEPPAKKRPIRKASQRARMHRADTS